MKLSTAIRLGSLAIQNPKPGQVQFCAIGMACEAIGKREMRQALRADNYETLWREWPWVKKVGLGRRWIGAQLEPMEYYEILYNLFDDNVCEEKLMTIEGLCDTVAGWERELAAKGIDVEQVTMAAELNQPASVRQSVPESASFQKLEQDVAK